MIKSWRTVSSVPILGYKHGKIPSKLTKTSHSISKMLCCGGFRISDCSGRASLKVAERYSIYTYNTALTRLVLDEELDVWNLLHVAVFLL